MEPDTVSFVMNILKLKADSVSERDRVCVLPFDECSISREWTYDKATDT